MNGKGSRFMKMAGGGNDFIMLNGQTSPVTDPARLAGRACVRGLSIGADGLIIVSADSTEADVRMLYFNSDGSRADFCANGTRCAARFAFLEGLAQRTMTIEADCGVVTATVLADDRVRLSVAGPKNVELEKKLELEDATITGAHLEVGVPHFVELVDDLWDLDVASRGRAVRRHPDLQPAGANANFISIRGRNRLDIRTFERGVEGETLSCGSGVIASVAASALSGRVDSPVTVRNRSGVEYEASFKRTPDALSSLELTGDARVVYEGTMTAETIEGFDPDWVRQPGGSDAGSS